MNGAIMAEVRKLCKKHEPLCEERTQEILRAIELGFDNLPDESWRMANGLKLRGGEELIRLIFGRSSDSLNLMDDSSRVYMGYKCPFSDAISQDYFDLVWKTVLSVRRRWHCSHTEKFPHNKKQNVAD